MYHVIKKQKVIRIDQKYLDLVIGQFFNQLCVRVSQNFLIKNAEAGATALNKFIDKRYWTPFAIVFYVQFA